jgi:hypothetical protein
MGKTNLQLKRGKDNEENSHSSRNEPGTGEEY